MTEPRDELLERYAEAVVQDPRRPSDRVRNAARAHAQMLRDQAALVQRAEVVTPTKPAANQPQWTISLVASLAVIGLAGVLYIQIDHGTPEDRDAALGTPPRTEAPATSTAASPAPSARSDAAQGLTPQRPAPAAEARKAPADKALAAAAPPAKMAAVTRKETPPNLEAMPAPAPAPAPVQEAEQPVTNAGAMRDMMKPEAGSESAARMATAPRPVAALTPAAAPAPVPAAPAATSNATAAATGTLLRRARDMEAVPASTLYLDAARAGNTEALQKLLAQGVAVNTRDDNGNTALMLAVRYRQAAAVRKLLAMGADTTLVNHEGLSALQLANQLGLEDMAQLLQTPR